MKTAIITGAAGQDGSYMADSLLAKGYEVHGFVRPSTRPDMPNLQDAVIAPSFNLHDVDLLETERLVRLVREIQPDEFYNLAACSFVPVSWDLPDYVTQVNAVAPLRILEAIRTYSSHTRFYQAGSSEMFGRVRPEDLPLHEESYHYPRSPYGATKSFAHNIVRNYRESFDLHASNGILFNHESERRDPRFVTRKITSALAKWYNGGPPLRIGNMDAVRDWGYSPDYVEAMQLMVRHENPGDWVIATGSSFTVRDFIEEAVYALDETIQWKGSGVKERGFDGKGREIVVVDPSFYRPAEVNVLCGDPSRARRALGWVQKTSFKAMVWKMVRHDVSQIEKQNRTVVS